MLSSIPPRWPRAFTALGFGAITLYMYAFIFGAVTLYHEVDDLVRRANDLAAEIEKVELELEEADSIEQEGAANAHSLKERHDALTLKRESILKEVETMKSSTNYRVITQNFEIEGESSRFVYATFLVFVAFVAGQICLSIGRFLLFDPSAAALDAHRIARVAASQNSVLVEELERHNSFLDVLSGCIALPVFFVIFLFASGMIFLAYSLLQAATGVLLASIIVFSGRASSRWIGERLDKILQSFEELNHESESRSNQVDSN